MMKAAWNLGGASWAVVALALTIQPSLELMANTPPDLPLAVALDATNLPWATGGDLPWFGQTQSTRDGIDAAQSSQVLPGNSSWVETVVDGPGSLQYYFQLRAVHTNTIFRLLVDGAPVHNYQLNLGWSGNGYAVPAGHHSLRWQLDNPVDGGGSTVAWLDEVTYVRDPVGPTNPPASSILVTNGSLWKYLDTGEDLGSVWREAVFNDWYWRVGYGQFGFGDGDEATVIRSSADPSGGQGIITYYFRYPFLVEERAQYLALHGRLLVDDGAVVYLNGAEVFRSNLPAGPIRSDTLAVVAAENQVTEFPIPLERLSNGFNVLAVEVHQNSASSSDVSFDLSVTAQRDPNLWPLVRLISPPNRTMLNGPTNVTLMAEASDLDGRLVRVEFLQGTNLLGTITPAPGEAFFSFVASNVPPVGAVSFFARAIDDQGAATLSRALGIGVVTYPIPPVVAVSASNPRVDEDQPGSAAFVVTRYPAVDTPLTVYFDLSGEAVNGEDFELVPLQVTIPAQASSAEVVISVIDDFDVEGVDPVTLTLRATPPGQIPSFPPGPNGYFLHEVRREATIRIEDDDVVLPPGVEIVSPAAGTRFVAPVNIPITAWELQGDFGIRSVEFFANEVSLGRAQRSSNGFVGIWSLTWSNVPPGDYILGAIALDERGRPSSARPVSIAVVPHLCPCDGPWSNRGEYVHCVLTRAWESFRAGLITLEQRRDIVRDAVRSECGKRDHEPVQLHLLPLTPSERHAGVRIILSGEAEAECVIETSSDLKHWRPMLTNPVTINGAEILCPPDPAATRFFRVRAAL